jgi:hypothetical protein
MKKKSKPYFEGWYYKQQAGGKTLAVIPGRADGGAFIQVVTETASYHIEYPLAAYKLMRRKAFNKFILQIGDNYFSHSGIRLNISQHDISLSGELKYRNLTPLNGDIMGPFRLFPMECRHEVISMKHHVSGEIILNGESLCFHDGTGYLEADSGHSFPESYTWAHSNHFKANCSIMAAIAKIPFCGFRFIGCICVVWLNGKEYRLATYKGVKILRCEHNLIELKQGKYHLVIASGQKNAHQLAAPKAGVMSRFIKESASCPAVFVFKINHEVVFSSESKNTSYEYAAV